MSKLLEQINTATMHTYHIKDVGRVITGKTPSKDNPLDWGNEVDFITPTDFFGNGKYLSNIKRKISKEGVNRYKNMILPPESVVVTCIGSDMGKVIVSKNKALTNQQINSIVVNKESFDLEFIYYVLKSLYPTLRSIAEEGGSTMPIITKSVFEQIEFEAPTLQIQKKIARILTAYDAKIENNNRIIKNLETAAKTIFNEWFINFHFPGHDKVKFIENEAREIPESWKVEKLSKISKITLGGTPPRDNAEYWGGNIPWINSGEINKLRVVDATECITEKGLKKSNARLMEVGTVLIAITGATLGQVSRLEIDSTANQSVVGVYDESKMINEYLYLYIKANILDLISGASGGAQQHINKQMVQDYEVIIPDRKLLYDFNKLIKPSFLHIRNRLFENLQLQRTRDQLLAKLI